MDFLSNYSNVVILGICLCVGFVVKKWIRDLDNKFIPTINAVLGLLLSIWMSGWSLTPDVILSGLVSGLSATGAYEAFRQYIEKGGKTDGN